MSAKEDLEMICENRSVTLEELLEPENRPIKDWVVWKLKSFGHKQADIEAAMRGGVSVSQLKLKAPGRSHHFQSDPVDVRPLLKYIPKHLKIWEPACGNGKIAELLREEGYDVVGTDILHGFDFLSPLAATGIQFDISLTNPPFDIKDQWLERCYQIGKPFALLMPNDALGGQGRCELYKKFGIELLVLPWRPTFTTPNGTEGGAWSPVCWFCYGLNLPSQITFAEAV